MAWCRPYGHTQAKLISTLLDYNKEDISDTYHPTDKKTKPYNPDKNTDPRKDTIDTGELFLQCLYIDRIRIVFIKTEGTCQIVDYFFLKI